MLSKLLKYIFRANKRVKRLISLLKAKELPSPTFSVFINIIHYIIISVKVVIVVVELSF